jgi:uncharacterized protein (TIGR02246 family)
MRAAQESVAGTRGLSNISPLWNFRAALVVGCKAYGTFFLEGVEMMKQTLALGALLIALLSVAPAQTPRGRAAQKHAVETFFMAGIEAFNAHDLDRFMKQFADDLEMYTPTGWLRGKASVRERFVMTFKQFPSVKMEIEDLRVREVAPATAVVDFKWRTYPTGSGPAFHGVGSGVYVLRRGRWVEVLEHETVVQVDEALRMNRP